MATNGLTRRLTRIEKATSTDPAQMTPDEYLDWQAAWWHREVENLWRRREGKEPLPELPQPPPVAGGFVELLDEQSAASGGRAWAG